MVNKLLFYEAKLEGKTKGHVTPLMIAA